MRPVIRKMTKNYPKMPKLTYFNINARHVLPAAAEAPRHEPGQLVVALVLAHEWAATVTLQVEIQA